MLRLHTWSPPIPCGMFLPHTSVWRYRFRHQPLNPSFIFKIHEAKTFLFLGIQKGAPKGALIGLLDITYLILSYRKRHYLYIELFLYNISSMRSN